MHSQYSKLVKKATYFAVIFSLILIIIKFFTWWITGSVSMLASLFDSSIDLLASGLNFVLIRYSLKPPDEDHRFGHGKAESLSALAQSAFIIGSIAFLLLNSIKLLLHPEPVNSPLLGIAISFISIVLTSGLILYQRYVIKQTNSQAIKADMLHYSADFFMNIAVVIALFLTWYGVIYADAVFALLIGAYILYSALKIIFLAIQDLLDKALPEEDNELILDIASSFPEVHGLHDLKTRRSGPMTFVQLHIELDDNMSLVQSHAIADKIEKLISQQFEPAEVIIHQDPLSVVPKEKPRLRNKFK
ncbi:ferrous-iron efflux pump FieF [Orbus hercynius]|uniref:Cation-efflux pump FieF n=1 Tax=Orbus hercynius TaxID=593135 RepID=A0A495REE2_9GAMM|nr:cation diffusion facilitator family transporter [Orbus hercynius]RKS85721.1 ferrous-iron efflux pump FieF [Orbus hercynius]